jgi:hypothetical protein
MKKPNDSIDPRVRQSLEHLSNVPPRDPQAAARGRAQFLSQAESLSRDLSRARVPRRTGWGELLDLFIRRKHFALTPLATVSLMVVLALGVTGAVVYAAQDDLPTDPLYRVKTLGEDVRLGFTGSPEAQVELSLEFANRRVEEMEALNRMGVVPPGPVAARLRAQLDRVLYTAAGLDDAGLTCALTQVQATIEQQTLRMAMVRANAPEQAQPIIAQVQAALTERHALAQMGLADPQAFRQRQRTQSGPQPTPFHTPSSGVGHGPAISQTVTPDHGLGPGHGISLAVTPGGTFTPAPSISPTATPGHGLGTAGPGTSLTVTPSGTFSPSPGISQTVTPGSSGSGDSQPTPEPGGGSGDNPQPTPVAPSGSGSDDEPQPTPGDGGGDNPRPTSIPGGGDGDDSQPTPVPGGGSEGSGDSQPTPKSGEGDGASQVTPAPGGGSPAPTPKSGGSSGRP